MLILQEEVRRAEYRFLLVMAWQPCLEQKQAEEVEFVSWSDAPSFNQIHKLLVAVESGLFIIEVVLCDIGRYAVASIAQFENAGPTLPIVGRDDVRDHEYDMSG